MLRARIGGGVEVAVVVRARQRPWVRELAEGAPAPVLRLVCFPHSGGGPGSYAAWIDAVRRDVQLLGVRYPGREDRFHEPPAASVPDMGAAVAAELSRLDALPCALFGHSLGALVAYETALALRDRGQPPAYLFVSGALPPARAGGGRTHLAGDDELWSTVRELGGIDHTLVEDAELRELLLPTLRADIAVHETYRPSPDSAALSCPVRCYHGIGDPLVSAAELAEWANVSTGPFTLRSRQGAHFHLSHNPAELVEDITDTLLPRTEGHPA
jgi:pyochelin biosynthesis protein PchC